MKVRRNLLIALSLLSLGANAQRIKGSDTVLPVAQQTAERFMNQHPDARVTVTGGGTGVGISALMDHTTGRHFPGEDKQLETGRRRRSQNSGLLARNIVRYLRIFQRERTEK